MDTLHNIDIKATKELLNEVSQITWYDPIQKTFKNHSYPWKKD